MDGLSSTDSAKWRITEQAKQCDCGGAAILGTSLYTHKSYYSCSGGCVYSTDCFLDVRDALIQWNARQSVRVKREKRSRGDGWTIKTKSN